MSCYTEISVKKLAKWANWEKQKILWYFQEAMYIHTDCFCSIPPLAITSKHQAYILFGNNKLNIQLK